MNTMIISPVNIEERKNLGIRAGDTVRVWQKIEEKGKTRLQAFEGLVLATKHGAEAGGTFTVRKVSSGVGVEKIFPLYSPMIDKIEIVKRVRVRRAKLYYIRDKVAREARRQLRRMRLTSITTESETGQAAEAEKQAAEEAERVAAEEKQAEKENAVDSEQVTDDSNVADDSIKDKGSDEGDSAEVEKETELEGEETKN